MRPCTCDSCFRFEQASGFPKFLAPRTIRHHLQKQKALPESPLVDFPPPPSLVASASSLPSLVDSPSSPSPPSLVDSPSLPSFLDSHSHISPDLPIEQGADEVPAIAFRGRGRPRASVVFANQPLGDLLLDTRDKFPNMTEGVLDSQFALHNANKSLGVDGDITGLQARRVQDRLTASMFQIFLLCHNHCSIKYGELLNAVVCPTCGAGYNGGHL